ncbi:Fet3 protein [Cyathus striatus]|nr:Fet3 protein [Cyathus striatus]
MHLLNCLILLICLVGPSWAGVHEIWWNITYVQNANPDGQFPRRVIGVNGTWPPPPIEINSTDSLVVHAFNSIDQPTTLHHHGMFFNSTSWFDGALGLSQCLTFHFQVDTSGQFGTYWVHSHAHGHYVDGLRAPVVIHPTKEHYSYDAEFTVVLGDWYHQQHDILLAQYISTSNPGGAEPVPDNALIYFSQNGTYLPPIPGTHPDPVTSAVGFNQNATINFQPGKTYRLRVVNTGAFASFAFWIDGHNMTIIEADGTDVQPSPIDTLKVAVAQRYSVLIRARTTRPQTTRDSYPEVNDISLVPINVVPQPLSTRTIVLLANFSLMTDGTNRAMFNNVTYSSPLVPLVLSELTTAKNATVQSEYGPSTFVINPFDVVDIVVQNADSGGHPFHIHGHQVQLIQRTSNFTSTDKNINPPVVEGQTNPMRRDTVQVPAGTAATLRFVADNPGGWFFHCHIEWHLEAGLAVQFLQQRNKPPPELQAQCTADGMPNSGNAAGHQSTTDLSGWPLGPCPTWNCGGEIFSGTAAGQVVITRNSFLNYYW